MQNSESYIETVGPHEITSIKHCFDDVPYDGNGELFSDSLQAIKRAKEICKDAENYDDDVLVIVNALPANMQSHYSSSRSSNLYYKNFQ